MLEGLYESILDWDWSQWLNFFTSPDLQTVQMAIVIYVGLLWLSIIIWVTRDAISRTNSLLFQVFAILMNIVFPLLGILLYLIIRPSKTVLERYYEELEHRLILESIEGKEHTRTSEHHPLKFLKHKVSKKHSRQDDPDSKK